MFWKSLKMETANFPETLVPIPAFMASYVSQKSETFLSTAFRTFYPWRHTFLTHSPRWVNIVITEQERRICCPRLLLAVFGVHPHPTVLQHTWLSGVSSQVRTSFRITTVLLMAVPFPDPFLCESKLQDSQHYFLYKIWIFFFLNLWIKAILCNVFCCRNYVERTRMGVFLKSDWLWHFEKRPRDT